MTLNDNIIGIDFIHKHKLHYDVQSRQVKISGVDANQQVAIKEQVLPALASTVMNVKFKGHIKYATYIASVHVPCSVLISGMPTIVSMDGTNNCKIIVNNCAPFDIIIERNDIIGLIDIETEQLIPLEDSVISSNLNDISVTLSKVAKKKLTKDEIVQNAHLNVPGKFKHHYVDILHKHQNAISAKNMTSDLQKFINRKSIQKMIIPCIASSSKFQRYISLLLNNQLMNGSNLECSNGLNHSTINLYSVCLRNKAMDFEWYKIFGNFTILHPLTNTP
jgi:hypothetical protein